MLAALSQARLGSIIVCMNEISAETNVLSTVELEPRRSGSLEGPNR
jgi:hypothetical protein